MHHQRSKTATAVVWSGLGLLAAMAGATLWSSAPPTTAMAAPLPAAPDGDPATALRDRQTIAALGLGKGDITALRVQRHDADDSISAAVVIDGKASTLRLSPSSVRGPNFKVLAQVDGGGYVEVDPGPERTYRGTIEDQPGSEVAASLLDDGLYAAVLLPDRQEFWIEPVAPRVPGAAADWHVAYKTSDVLNCEGNCGVDDRGHIGPVAPARRQPAQVGALLANVTTCFTQVACDADYEYFQHYGTVQSVNNRIAAVFNAMNVQYSQEVGITYMLSTVIVRSSANDPYTATAANALLDEFSGHWNANQGGVPRDVAQLFTNKELDSSIIGLASLGTICDLQYAYSLVQSDAATGFGCTTDLSAHELGHNWNATHCPCAQPPYTMNAYLVCANTFHPTFSIPEIESFRDSCACLNCAELLEQKFTVSGEEASDRLGPGVAMINDINGDGKPDLVIGAPENDENGVAAGKVYAVSGATGAVLWSKLGATAGDRFGYAVCAAGGKVLVGSPYFNYSGMADAGRVYALNASNGAQLKTFNGRTAADHFGWSLGSADLNNDGVADFIIGAPLYNSSSTVIDNGAVYAYNGSTYALLKKLVGQQNGDRFGYAVAGIGTANAGATEDFAVGAPYNDDAGTNAGKVYGYAGGTYAQLFTALTGAAAGDQFGRALAGLGAIDSAPGPEFAVGAPYYDTTLLTNCGAAYIYRGNGVIVTSKVGSAPNAQFGSAITAAGDVDHDGRMDFAVGAPLHDSNGADSGSVYVYTGRDYRQLIRLDGEAAGDRLGGTICGRALSVSNTSPLLAAVARYRDTPASDAGRAYFYAMPAVNPALHGVAGSGGGANAAAGQCAGDVAGHDGVINVADLSAVLNLWAACPVPCPPTCIPDVNRDCKVDVDDLLLILNAWGPCR